ncbi:leucine-rich repeat protein [Tanacetum coccineum]
MQNGISAGYDEWTHHGESCDVSDDSDDDVSFNDEDVGSDNMNGDNDDDDTYDDLDEMLDNIGQGTWGDKWKTNAESSFSIDKDLESPRRLLDDSHQELYTGCQSYSKFSFIVTMLHLKTTNGWSNKSFNDTLNVFKKALPSPSSVPKNFYEAKKYIRDLGFRGEKIHACVNDCVLYRVSNDMRWHKDVRVNDDNVATHPADSEAWKHFDREFPLFANDPRNVRLGLATDGFNPFGNLSSSYSIWPVFVVPYNLPPWKCMKDPYMFMSMLIPGPKTPTNIDVYLQPLIDELNDLWGGINAYDAHRKENFTLRAALLWTINDFPAYGMLSGWSVKGYNACPICMNETSSSYLSHSRKVCYMGHRRFLPSSHQWRNDKKNFDGTRETRKPIVPMSGLEVLHDIDCTISEPCCSVKKRKRRPLGSKITRGISNIELEKIHTYILNNCDEMVELINEHKLKLEKENCNNINELHDKHFTSWLQERVNNCPESFKSEIRLLSRGPLSVNEYSGCMVNGFKFHTQSREMNRKTQHSGVVVQGHYGINTIDFYGILQEVLEVEYLGQNKRVLVFKYQPYILASQAKQVFYAPDLKLGKNWHVVLSNPLRKIFNVPVGDVYQEEEPQLNLNVDLNLEQSSLRRGSTLLELVDAITFSGDSTGKSSKNRLLIDEEYIDDEETDSSDLESFVNHHREEYIDSD